VREGHQVRRGRSQERGNIRGRPRRDHSDENEVVQRSRLSWQAEEDIERRLRRIERRRGVIDSDSDGEPGNPLAPHIINFPNPEGFRRPPLTNYDGTTDPTDHIYQFTVSMDAACAPEEVRCRLFPTTLTGITAKWYCKLPAGRINSWPAMVNQFKRQFWVHHERMKDAISLADIKQGESESLRDYVKRFNHAAARVKGADERLMHYALITGVRKGTAFAQKLLMKKTEDLQDFYEKADRYMRLEESELERKKSEAKNASTPGAESRKKKSGENSQKGSGVKQDGRNDDGQGGQERGRFNNNNGERTDLYTAYTALTRPRVEIYEATRDKVAYRRPSTREATKEEKNSGRYYRFHMMAGHDTNACRHLKDLIEDYIKKHNEHLTRFVQRPRGQGNSSNSNHG